MDKRYFLAPPTEGADGHSTLDFDKSPTVQLVFAANRFTRNSARLYQESFGIGAMDWRMLVMLTKEPESSVARCSVVIGIDKAAVSRSLTRLEKEGLVTSTAPHSDPRRKVWRLTQRGQDLHGEILETSLNEQMKLLKGFSMEEVKMLTTLLARLQENMESSAKK
ncbi:MarR family transcriptional regulator [Sneathiella sp. P13V-1]|uniref:MarR family winged helix-turn-helix transcriptional regulator n=1 Tax=Sneathiella sp. P13V-1 TaxID=2697366 RepID=UPI00187B3F14|nr:MarR family transcriptional regulator [Sneathiella sp. P13V-1]MBE7638026.1 MarR family transcriptional regulator [Sneathiella sp. P13V-1]